MFYCVQCAQLTLYVRPFLKQNVIHTTLQRYTIHCIYSIYYIHTIQCAQQHSILYKMHNRYIHIIACSHSVYYLQNSKANFAQSTYPLTKAKVNLRGVEHGWQQFLLGTNPLCFCNVNFSGTIRPLQLPSYNQNSKRQKQKRCLYS